MSIDKLLQKPLTWGKSKFAFLVCVLYEMFENFNGRNKYQSAPQYAGNAGFTGNHIIIKCVFSFFSHPFLLLSIGQCNKWTGNVNKIILPGEDSQEQ